MYDNFNRKPIHISRNHNINYKSTDVSNKSYDRIDKLYLYGLSSIEKFDLTQTLNSFYLSNQKLDPIDSDKQLKNANNDISNITNDNKNELFNCISDNIIKESDNSDISIQEADRLNIMSNTVKQFTPVINKTINYSYKNRNINIKWKETNYLQNDTDSNNPLVVISEPFRPVPTCVRDLVSKYLPILSVNSVISLTSKDNQNNISSHENDKLTLGYPLTKMSILYKAAKRMKISDDNSNGDFGPIINSYHPKVQAVECTLGRHIEGLLDSLLETVFDLFDIFSSELFSTSTNNKRSHNEINFDVNWETILNIIQLIGNDLTTSNTDDYQTNTKLPKLHFNKRVIQRSQNRILSTFTTNHNYKPLDKETPTFVIKNSTLKFNY